MKLNAAINNVSLPQENMKQEKGANNVARDRGLRKPAPDESGENGEVPSIPKFLRSQLDENNSFLFYCEVSLCLFPCFPHKLSISLLLQDFLPAELFEKIDALLLAIKQRSDRPEKDTGHLNGRTQFYLGSPGLISNCYFGVTRKKLFSLFKLLFCCSLQHPY